MIDIDDCIGLDFETYSAVDLFQYGLHNYVSSPTFRPLIAATYESGFGNPIHHDFIRYEHDWTNLLKLIEDKYIVAHNAGFERAVLKSQGIDLPADRFIDSAVRARMMGAAGKLEAAAPQLLNSDKLEDGKRLIQKFSIPSKQQVELDQLDFDTSLVVGNADLDWELFHRYCGIDAKLGFQLAKKAIEEGYYTDRTHAENAVTMEMNDTGWHVDRFSTMEMYSRYLDNLATIEAKFRELAGAEDLNFNSLKQMKEWCAERGVKATSFDEKAVQRMLIALEKKLLTSLPDDKRNGYTEVVELLKTKQALGGSSLKKLPVILDTMGSDDRLRDQYLHVGAGQTYRTTGRSAQMQNLKRLGSEVMDMGVLNDPFMELDNDTLALNIRQLFTSEDPEGELIVGDFSSIESRGLGWYTDEQYKIEAYAQGKDLYKVLASEIFTKPIDQITKAERQIGKVGELSCGYQAGPEAVQSFAKGMGVDMSPEEAAKLVRDWRGANPKTVKFWWDLDEALHRALTTSNVQVVWVGPAGSGYRVTVSRRASPISLRNQLPHAYSLYVRFCEPDGNEQFRRVFHGVYEKGRSLIYHKPSDLKSGDLWKDWFINPKTKQRQNHSIYGGKLAGILTQSLCRELFFDCLRKVNLRFFDVPNVKVIGQFHDEIVLDWVPPKLPGSRALSLRQTQRELEYFMTKSRLLGFPMAAEVKSDYRYIK